MKYITSSLYNSLSDMDCTRSQLHIYAVENEEEYNRLDDMLTCGDIGEAEKELLAELGYHSDTIPIEAIAGREYTTYHARLFADFLVIEEIVVFDC